MAKPCKVCESTNHTAFTCPKKPRKQLTSRSKPLSSNKVTSITRKKKTPRQALKKRLELLVKEYVKKRDNYTCQRCGKKVEGTNCHASHVIPVSRSGRLQFDPINMKVLCYHDHINWWHKHPVEAGKWFVDTFPERWEYLETVYKEGSKPIKQYELEELISKYESGVTDVTR